MKVPILSVRKLIRDMYHVKFNEKGEVLESFWDLAGLNHPMITSMREHRGYLYLGGIANNRIGRYKLADADPNFVQYDRRWGKQS